MIYFEIYMRYKWKKFLSLYKIEIKKRHFINIYTYKIDLYHCFLSFLLYLRLKPC